MRCYLCGRLLLRAAAELKTADGVGYAGPTCALRAGLTTAPMPRMFTVARKPRQRRASAQMEIAA